MRDCSFKKISIAHHSERIDREIIVRIRGKKTFSIEYLQKYCQVRK